MVEAGFKPGCFPAKSGIYLIATPKMKEENVSLRSIEVRSSKSLPFLRGEVTYLRIHQLFTTFEAFVWTNEGVSSDPDKTRQEVIRRRPPT